MLYSLIQRLSILQNRGVHVITCSAAGCCGMFIFASTYGELCVNVYVRLLTESEWASTVALSTIVMDVLLLVNLYLNLLSLDF